MKKNLDNVQQGIEEINKILKKRNLTFWTSEWFGIGEIKNITQPHNGVFEVERTHNSVCLSSETKNGTLKIEQ
jgi:hypothetical protein